METEHKLNCRVHTRITQAKFDELITLLSNSRGIRSLSELMRNILDERIIMVHTYDNSLDKVMGELSSIRKELQSIGVNINQVTHRFHLEELEEAKLFHATEIVKLYQQTDLKVSKLFEIIANLSEIWLPRS